MGKLERNIDDEREYDSPKYRVPYEQLSPEEITVLAAQSIYRTGTREEALEFFKEFDQLLKDSNPDSSYVWVHPSGRLYAFISDGVKTLRALHFNPEHPEDDIHIDIVKSRTYHRLPRNLDPEFIEPTYYFGDADTFARLRAREEINLEDIKDAEDIVKLALARDIWGRKEAAHGITFQGQRAYLLLDGQREEITDAKMLRKLLERIIPDETLSVYRPVNKEESKTPGNELNMDSAASYGLGQLVLQTYA